jgi:Ribbon-helix-helix protein, copG family
VRTALTDVGQAVDGSHLGKFAAASCVQTFLRAEPPSFRIHNPTSFVYANQMSEHLLNGKPVTDEQIQAWADEAEAGYDLSKLPKPRRGRPPVGDGPGAVIPVRLDASTLAALTARAEAEGITTRSDAIRAAVREWSHIA